MFFHGFSQFFFNEADFVSMFLKEGLFLFFPIFLQGFFSSFSSFSLFSFFFSIFLQRKVFFF